MKNPYGINGILFVSNAQCFTSFYYDFFSCLVTQSSFTHIMLHILKEPAEINEIRMPSQRVYFKGITL